MGINANFLTLFTTKKHSGKGMSNKNLIFERDKLQIHIMIDVVDIVIFF